LTSAFLAEHFGNALKVCIGIATIGPGVEDYARRVKSAGNLSFRFALEALSALALDAAVETYFSFLDEMLGREGLHSGVPFAPGETSGWPLQDQRVIFDALDGDLEKVTINDACLLIPRNSISFAVGIFDHPVKTEGDSHCSYCSMRETCLYRIR
jgi:hypothetical protein